MMRTFTLVGLFVTLLLQAALLRAEIVVIVNPALDISSMSQNDVQRIFLGKNKRFINGEPAVPIVQSSDNDISSLFITEVLGKSQEQYRAYWSRFIFTGKGNPPQELDSDYDVKKMVSKNPEMIGYIDADSVDATVKVVFRKGKVQTRTRNR